MAQPPRAPGSTNSRGGSDASGDGLERRAVASQRSPPESGRALRSRCALGERTSLPKRAAGAPRIAAPCQFRTTAGSEALSRKVRLWRCLQLGPLPGPQTTCVVRRAALDISPTPAGPRCASPRRAGSQPEAPPCAAPKTACRCRRQPGVALRRRDGRLRGEKGPPWPLEGPRWPRLAHHARN